MDERPPMVRRGLRGWWAVVRRVWVIVGSLAGLVFVLWSLWAYRATADARRALEGDARVTIEREADFTRFTPAGAASGTGLVFFAGALVDPVAYAPLARRIAGEGYAVLVVDLPRRGAFGGADGPGVIERADRAMRSAGGVTRWVAAGHSRGGAVAARAVHQNPARFAGLALIGTSHPRDISLAHLSIPVTRIYGTRDTVADVEKLDATRQNLPPATRLVPIDGGNHSQFGYYGFQPGDWPATISREAQQRATGQAVIDLLERVSRRQGP